MKIVAAGDKTALHSLYRGGWDPPAQIIARVAEILRAVRARGDTALIEFTREFDDPGYDVGRIRVAIPLLEEARSLISGKIAEALQLAKERVADFHQRQLPIDLNYTQSDGTTYGFCNRALDSVAAYVPGGSACLPSSVIMTTVPARIAGVERIIVLTPPQRAGGVNPAILYACALCEVDELYALGGAQAIAGAAYGTTSIAKVDKIVGPGSMWVTEAKRQVFGSCAIDGLAGPSEVLVVADDGADVEYVIGELLAQAEHDPLARVALVSESEAVLAACSQQLDALKFDQIGRGEIVKAVLECNCYLIQADSLAEIADVIDRFAPEHLSLQMARPETLLPLIKHAGAVFIGAYTPVACGDYVAGTNHVLPTSGAARFSSGLRTADFMRSFSVVENSRERMIHDAPILAALADFEGLGEHARSARIRNSP